MWHAMSFLACDSPHRCCLFVERALGCSKSATEVISARLLDLHCVQYLLFELTKYKLKRDNIFQEKCKEETKNLRADQCSLWFSWWDSFLLQTFIKHLKLHVPLPINTCFFPSLEWSSYLYLQQLYKHPFWGCQFSPEQPSSLKQRHERPWHSWSLATYQCKLRWATGVYR